MDNKKIKLTITGTPKKTFKSFDSTKAQGKKTVVIEKKTLKNPLRSNYSSSPGFKS